MNQNEEVKKFFVDIRKGVFKCTLCNQEYKGKTSNKCDHLTSKHKEESGRLNLRKRPRTSTKEKNPSEEGENSGPPKNIRVVLDIDPNKEVAEIVKFFLQQNISLSCADKFSKIHFIEQFLKQAKITINREKMREYVLKCSSQMYELIKEETKGKLISIMFDSASRNKRHVFGVTIRYMHEGSAKERVLGVLTQKNRQFGSVLAQEVTSLLEKIGKTADDVYVSCTDNGANMVKTSDIIIEAQKEINLIQLFSDDEVEIDHMSVLSEARALECLDLVQDLDEFTTEPIINHDAVEETSEAIINLWDEEIGHLGSIARCGAHCLQLASVKITKLFEPYINPIRTFVKQSRLVANRHIFSNIPSPDEDTITRWSSTYRMINAFYINKELYQTIQHPSFILNDDTWEFITEFRNVFKPVDDSILYFQAERHTMSDCFVQWLKMEYKITICPEGFYGIKEKLLPKLKDESKKFLNCDAMIANLIYDPRIEWKFDSPIFNAELFKKGFNNIVKVFVAIEPPVTPSVRNEMSEGDLLLRELLGHVSNERVEVENLKTALHDFAFKAKRISADDTFDIIQFWSKLVHSEKFFMMAKLSAIVLAAPFTQVSVERAFSIFALTLTHIRTKLSPDALNSILVARENSDLLEKIKFL